MFGDQYSSRSLRLAVEDSPCNKLTLRASESSAKAFGTTVEDTAESTLGASPRHRKKPTSTSSATQTHITRSRSATGDPASGVGLGNTMANFVTADVGAAAASPRQKKPTSAPTFPSTTIETGDSSGGTMFGNTADGIQNSITAARTADALTFTSSRDSTKPTSTSSASKIYTTGSEFSHCSAPLSSTTGNPVNPTSVSLQSFPATPPPATASSSRPTAAASTKSSTNKTMPIVVGIVVPLVLMILSGAAFFLYKRRQRARDRREWERTHEEIADAVREIGGPATVPAWSQPSHV
ncbi:hypothetical protein B0H16DRAFT_1562402, partial [Mycena metata]